MEHAQTIETYEANMSDGAAAFVLQAAMVPQYDVAPAADPRAFDSAV